VIRRVARLLRMLKSLLRSTQISDHNLLSLLHVVTARNHVTITIFVAATMTIINMHCAQSLFGTESPNVSRIMRHDYAQIYTRNEATVTLYRDHVCSAVCTHSAATKRKEKRQRKEKKRGKKKSINERLQMSVEFCIRVRVVCVCVCARVCACVSAAACNACAPPSIYSRRHVIYNTQSES